jgi:DnaJ family protein C protein 11
LLNPRVGVLKGTYSIDPLTFITGTAQVRNFQGPAPLVMTFGRRITKGATGYMTYRTGEWAIGSWGPVFERRRDFSSMALGVSSQDGDKSYQVELQTGLMQSHLSVDRTWTWDSSTRVRVGGSLSTTAGINASIGGDRQVTDHTKVGLAVEVGLSGGVAFNIKYVFFWVDFRCLER